MSTTAWSVTAEEGCLVLHWSVPRARAGSFFRIWRARADGLEPGARPSADAVLATPEPIGPEQPGGTDYLFRDDAIEPGVPMVYWIEDQTGDFGGPWTATLQRGPGTLSLRALDNPFTESLRLNWSAPTGSAASIGIYDVAGRRLRSTDRLTTAGGAGEWIWDGRDAAGRSVPAGVYWIQLRAEQGRQRGIKVLRVR